MSASLSKISERLNLPESKLMEESLKAYLEREIKLAEEDIGVLRDRYGVPSRADLEERIKRKEIYSHPAWEDLIVWENLEEHIVWLKETLRQVG
jgi:hypothetical protein